MELRKETILSKNGIRGKKNGEMETEKRKMKLLTLGGLERDRSEVTFCQFRPFLSPLLPRMTDADQGFSVSVAFVASVAFTHMIMLW